MTLNLNELKRLAEEATQGPWEDGDRWVFVVPGESEPPLTRLKNVLRDVPEAQANATLIAAANPATILALIARIEELEARNALQQRALDEMRATNAANSVGQGAAQAAQAVWQYLALRTVLDTATAVRIAPDIVKLCTTPTANGAGGQG